MAVRQTLPVLPLRGAVVFPDNASQLSVGRAGSLRAIESALRADRLVFAVAQRDDADEPTAGALHTVGVVARVGLLQRSLEQGVVQATLEGQHRAQALQYTPDAGHITAVIASAADLPPAEAHTRAFARLVAEARERTIELGRRRGLTEAGMLTVLDSVRSGGALADLVANDLDIGAAEKQAVLETLSVEQRLRRVVSYLDQKLREPRAAAREAKVVGGGPRDADRGTSRDVFVSHSRRDVATAEAVCRALEARGVRCWIAPRDVQPGRDWDDAIAEAVEHCRVFVLVYSEHAGSSPSVLAEIRLAHDERKLIVPFRIDASAMPRPLRLRLNATQWLDAVAGPLETHLAALERLVTQTLATPAAQQAEAAVDRRPALSTSGPGPGARSREAEPTASAAPLAFGAAGTRSTETAPADERDAQAQYHLGVRHERGDGVARDLATAKVWYRAAAAQHHVAAQTALGRLAIAERDYETALGWLHPAAEQGRADAQYLLAILHEHGAGLGRDVRAARRWYLAAAEQQHLPSQTALGQLALDENDGPEAIRWLRPAAERGHADAQFLLGRILESGRGVVRNYGEAERWYRAAAAQGHEGARAQF